MKAAAMSHRMIEFPVSSGNSHRVKESDVKEEITDLTPIGVPKLPKIPDNPLAKMMKGEEKEDFTGIFILEIEVSVSLKQYIFKNNLQFSHKISSNFTLRSGWELVASMKLQEI